MGDSTKAVSSMAKRVVKDAISGLMDRSIREISRVTIVTVSESYSTQTESDLKDSGRMG
jgi:hypothetical protein